MINKKMLTRRKIEKVEAGLEVLILIISIFAFAYILAPVKEVSSSSGNNLLSFLFVAISNIKDKLAEPIIKIVSAETITTNVCCERLKNGAWCQNDKQENCDANYASTPTSCDATSFCKQGCCYDSSEGTCAENTPQKVCNDNGGTWGDSAQCEIPQCSLGCCVLDTQAAFVTLTRCKKLTSFYGLQTNFNPGVKSEIECIASVQAQDQGACVFDVDYIKTCKFATRGNCVQGVTNETGSITSNFTFYKDYLCSAEELATNCGLTKDTICVPGKDEVYFVDSCGNPANIYDSAKVNDKSYWKKVISKAESCGAGNTNGNANSPGCGNCDYFSGSFCRKDEARKASYGNNICADLSCKNTYNGKDYKNGEGWCVNDKNINFVGSRYFRHVCANGEEILEPCADSRQEVCIQDSITTNKGVFSQAACRANIWRDCVLQDEKVDCENTDKRDCKWIEVAGGGLNIAANEQQAASQASSGYTPNQFSTGSVITGFASKDNKDKLDKIGVCVPKDAPGLKFYSEGDASGICGQANSQCIVEFEKGLIGSKANCVENCECLEDSWKQERNKLCTSLGDCGNKINYLGKQPGKQGYKVKTEKVDTSKFFLPLLKLSAFVLFGEVGVASGETNYGNIDPTSSIGKHRIASLELGGVWKQVSVNGKDMLKNRLTGNYYTLNIESTNPIQALAPIATATQTLVPAESAPELPSPRALAGLNVDVPVASSSGQAPPAETVAPASQQAVPGATQTPPAASTTTGWGGITQKYSSFKLIDGTLGKNGIAYKFDGKDYLLSENGQIYKGIKGDDGSWTGWQLDTAISPTTQGWQVASATDAAKGFNLATGGIASSAGFFINKENGLAYNPTTGEQMKWDATANNNQGGWSATGAAASQSFWDYGMGYVLKAAGVAIGIGGAASMLAGFIFPASSNAQMAAFFAGSLGTGAYYAIKHFFPNLGTGWSVAAGIGVGILIFVLLYKEKSQKIITFECQPWEAPLKGEDCEKCNQDDMKPCSEYKCKSLGQACELLNAGTKEEMCTWVSRQDVKSPGIKKWDAALTKGYKVDEKSYLERPPGGEGDASGRMQIIKNDGSCVQAFTPLSFGIVTSEPSECKIDYNHTSSFDDMAFYFGASNLYKYNHTQIMSLPGPSNINKEFPELKNDGTYSLYVRCRDANGNENVDEFTIKFCVDKGPDVTAPVIVDTSITNGMPISFGLNQTPLDVYVNEPSECKWSKLDRSYENMENTMNCATSLSQGEIRNNILVYKCSATLTGLENNKDNLYYFRCKDQPKAAENERNVNTESYKFVLIGTQSLNILKVEPNNVTIKGYSTNVPVMLKIETANGYKQGDAICYYSLTGDEKDYLKFLNTATNLHEQRQDLPGGSYTYYFKCVDLGNNAAYDKVSFKVEVDQQAPNVVRAYNDMSGKLKIVTDEKSTCAFSLNDCNFAIMNGIEMPYANSSEHSADWKIGITYYIRCADESGNEPISNRCSIKVKAES